MTNAIVATEELRNTVSQVSPFSPDQITAMVKQRTTVDATELASYTRTLIGTKMRDVLVARPLLKEVKRRFKILPREKQVDGTYLEIDGTSSFEKWCEKHEKFIGSSRNAYYILNGGNKNRKPKPSTRRGAPWSKIDGGATVLEAFSTVQKDIRRCAAPGDSYEREAIDFTKRLYFFGWDIWKRLLIIASEDIGLADISVSKEVSRLWEVSKTVKDAKHSDLLMLVEAVAICCRAKKSRAMDNAINCKQTWTAMTDEEAKNAIADTTIHAVPSYANDGLHTGKKNDGTVAKFLVDEDAALGNRSSIPEIFPLPTVSHVVTKRADGLFYDENGSEWTQVKPPDDPDPEPPKPTKKAKTKKAPKPKTESKPQEWSHHKAVVFGPEADALDLKLATAPWTISDSDDREFINYGMTYAMGGIKNSDGNEYPIEDWMLPVGGIVAGISRAPFNYVQCHRMGPSGVVKPHRDPAGMIVPMVTRGQCRTFRFGGKLAGLMRQSQRKLTHHTGFTEMPMDSGDLLIFNGGKIVHSMDIAATDPNFKPYGFAWRYSLLFRWTTPAMREFGPGDAARKAGHDEQYKEAIENYRNGLTDFLGRKVKP